MLPIDYVASMPKLTCDGKDRYRSSSSETTINFRAVYNFDDKDRLQKKEMEGEFKHSMNTLESKEVVHQVALAPTSADKDYLMMQIKQECSYRSWH